MKTIQDNQISSRPIAIPDDADLSGMERTREKLAREIEAIEALNKARESSDYQKVVLDSYEVLRLTERAAIMLDPKKPDFVVTFAGLQGRWRERFALTNSMIDGTRVIKQRRNLLAQFSDKIEALRSKLRAMKQK